MLSQLRVVLARSFVHYHRGVVGSLAALALVAALTGPASAQVGCQVLGATSSGGSTAADFACGPAAVATSFGGDGATAIGSSLQAVGDGATAVGYSSLADGRQATALGNDASALSDRGTAIGADSVAANLSTSIGYRAGSLTGAGPLSVNIGAYANAALTGGVGQDGNGGVAIGTGDGASTAPLSAGLNSIAIGSGNSIFGGGGAQALEVSAIAIGQSSVASARWSMAMGSGAGASANYAVALGNAAAASGLSSFAGGDGSSASGASATALGHGASASGTNSFAAGNNAQATGASGIALGDGAIAGTGANAIAIGTGAVATGSVAIGAGAAAGLGNTAIGDGAVANVAAGASAFGAGASATAANSVAIGSGSVATAANTVSVGSAGNERRITNVAAGVAPTDAATVSQLSSVASGLQGQISSFQGQISSLQTQVTDNLREARAGIALAMAAGALQFDQRPGKVSIAGSYGNFKGSSGLAVGIGYAATERLRFNATFSASPDQSAYGGVVSTSLTLN